MRAKTTALPLLLALLFAGTGCTDLSRMSSSFQHLVSTKTDRFLARRVIDDPIYLEASGTMSVDIESFNGSVELEVDPRLDHVAVLIERLATHGYGRKWEADMSLREIQYSVDIVPSHLGRSLRIRTSTTHPEPHFQHVRLNIAMPDVEGVVIRTQNGDVVVSNVRGPIDIVTNDGDVRVMSERPLIAPVSIINRDGDIDYRVRAESTGVFDGEAERGKVSHHTRRGSMMIRGATDSDTLQATLNDGSNPVYLRTTDGDIRVSVVPDPTNVGVIIRH